MTNEPPTAFPWTHKDMTCTGMTLRDYFAAQSIQTAMQMVKHDLKKDEQDFFWNQIEREIVASRTYQLADAMMKARTE